jgi:hypothetical protein
MKIRYNLSPRVATHLPSHKMIRLDPETMQTPLQEVEELDIILAQIPTKALYGIQESVMKEV